MSCIVELYCDTDPVYTSSLYLVAAAKQQPPHHHPQDSRRRHTTHDRSAFVRKAPRTIVELAIACGYLAPPPASSVASSSASMVQYLLQRPLLAYIDPAHRYQAQQQISSLTKDVHEDTPSNTINTTNTPATTTTNALYNTNYNTKNATNHGTTITATTALGNDRDGSVAMTMNGVGAHARWSQTAQRTLHYLAHLLRELLAHWRSYCADRAQERNAAVRVRQRVRTWLLQVRVYSSIHLSICIYYIVHTWSCVFVRGMVHILLSFHTVIDVTCHRSMC